MVRLAKYTKYNKGRYIAHSKVVIATSKPYVLNITKVISSPRKESNKLVLVKGAVVSATGVTVQIVSKVLHNIPLGKVLA